MWIPLWSDSVRFFDNKACSQQFAQCVESQKNKEMNEDRFKKSMNEDRFKKSMNEDRFKKSMSTSPLYRSTIDDIVDEDNVVSITEELKVFVWNPFLFSIS